MQRIAIVSDSHGNATALAAVIADARQMGADTFLSVGDLTMRGPSPQACIDLLRQVNTQTWVLGNHEQTYADLNTTDKVPLKKPKSIMSVVQSAYDKNDMDAATYRFLATLPLKQTLTLENVTMDVFHAAPDQTHGVHVQATDKQRYFNALLEDSNSDLAIYGHIHQQLLRWTTDGRPIINAGTVGLPNARHILLQDQRAEYAVLTLDNGKLCGLDFRHVAYNIDHELEIARHKNLPYYELYKEALTTGQYAYTQEKVAAQNQKHHYKHLAKQFLKQKTFLF
ncbi:metallophosphoesterase family protein [Lactobacillus selangorensis]|nr:metallophosphoesterase family protein [Lactobacillus selangorensis]